jgi:D-alanyl-D-alanine carboxypeptidase/D-alanyl-D-alanine-endopeptidase (penicillin-binding protein 4)
MFDSLRRCHRKSHALTQKLLILVPLALTFPPLQAQTIDSLALDRLSDAVVELQNSELMRNGVFAFSLKSTQSGQTILGINQEQSVPSASTLKLISTATALSVLGGDYTYPTYLEYDGQVVRDTLRGDLYLRGTGDPSLGSDLNRFEGVPNGGQLLSRWTEAVRRAGIRYVQGQVVADPTIFDDKNLADTWVWGDLGNYYGAGVQGLNFRENLYRISFKAGRNVGDPTEVVKLEPDLSYLKIENRVTTGEAGSGDQVYIYASPLGEQILLTGTVPRGVTSFTVKGAIPRPAYAAAFELTRALKEAGVGVAGAGDVLPRSLAAAVPRTVIDQYSSPTLRDLAKETNWWSINLYADALLKTAGVKLNGKPDFDKAAEAEADYWRKKGADMRGFFVKDGSGLSPTGSLTAQNLTDVLNVATKDKNFTDFYNSIAILGETGTIRNIGRRTKAAGNVRAKSGSIGGTRAYAGYVTTKQGDRLSFAMIAHKYLPDGSSTVGLRLRELLILLGEM